MVRKLGAIPPELARFMLLQFWANLGNLSRHAMHLRERLPRLWRVLVIQRKRKANPAPGEAADVGPVNASMIYVMYILYNTGRKRISVHAYIAEIVRMEQMRIVSTVHTYVHTYLKAEGIPFLGNAS